MKRGSPIQRRTPLSRGGGLARTAGLSRSTRLAPVNRERKAKTFARNFGERAEAVRAMPCLVAVKRFADLRPVFAGTRHHVPMADILCNGDVQAAHARARGMGGAKGNRRELTPLCAGHHAEAGEFRTSARAKFEREHGISLTDEAARIAVELDERGLP